MQDLAGFVIHVAMCVVGVVLCVAIAVLCMVVVVLDMVVCACGFVCACSHASVCVCASHNKPKTGHICQLKYAKISPLHTDPQPNLCSQVE